MTNEINRIAPHSITAAGIEMACEWAVSYSGKSVVAFYDLDGDSFRMVFRGEHGTVFTAAMRAAKRGDTTDVDGDDLMTILGEAEIMNKREAPAAVNPDKLAHGPVPEKWFIGQALTGKSWTIRFDGDAGKTRVIFKRKPADKVLNAVKAAGFYWSPSLKSWNKGLTWRAYRAAEKLHAELGRLSA